MFDKMFNLYNEKNIKYESCDHLDTDEEKGFIICIECGEQIQRLIHHKLYFRDISRTQFRYTYERNIDKDVIGMNISSRVIYEANKIYDSVTKGKILRGNSRKGVIFACIYYAYKITENYQIRKNLLIFLE